MGGNYDKDAVRIIRELGGTAKAAQLCEVTSSAVSQWRRTGIPKAQLRFLKAVRPAFFCDPSHPGRQPPSPRNILDTVPEGGIVSPFPHRRD